MRIENEEILGYKVKDKDYCVKCFHEYIKLSSVQLDNLILTEEIEEGTSLLCDYCTRVIT